MTGAASLAFMMMGPAGAAQIVRLECDTFGCGFGV
jgi:hypothetical protein